MFSSGSLREGPAPCPADPAPVEDILPNPRASCEGPFLASVPARLSLALLGGFAYAAHSRSSALPWLTLISTVPWILLILGSRLRGAFWAFALSVYLMLLGSATWLTPLTFGGWLISPCFYLPFYLPLYGVRQIRRAFPRLPLALLWPIAFTGLEWVRVRCCTGEVSFTQLGYGVAGWSPLLQTADLFGVYGLTFIASMASGSAADLLLGDRLGLDRRKALTGLSLTAFLWIFAAVYGIVRNTPVHLTEGPVVMAIQPALSHAGDGRSALRNFRREMAQTLRVFQSLRDVQHVRPEAVFWPENSVNDVIPTDGSRPHGPYADDLSGLAIRLRIPLLADGPTRDRSTGRLYHSALLFQPDGRTEVYHRIALVPWSEYVPFHAFLHRFLPAADPVYLSLVGNLIGRVPTFQSGDADGIHPFSLHASDGRLLTFGTPICSESGSARVVNLWHRSCRPGQRTGVDFLVNPTSEGLLGTEIHEQMLTICRFRAVEGRVSVVRASNDGISALIDPNGRVRDMLRGERTGSPIREPGSFHPRILLDSRTGTFYSRHGDWLPALSFIVTLIVAAASHLARRDSRSSPYRTTLLKTRRSIRCESRTENDHGNTDPG